MENGRFVWKANQDALEDALDEIADAEQDYADAIDELAHEQLVASLNELLNTLDYQKEATAQAQDKYDELMEDSIEKLNDVLDAMDDIFEEDIRPIDEILQDIAENGMPKLKEQVLKCGDYLEIFGGSVAEALEMVSSSLGEKAEGSGSVTVKANDSGGLNTGKGWMLKDTIEPERVLSPEQTQAFDRLVDEISTGNRVYNLFDPEDAGVIKDLIKTEVNSAEVITRGRGLGDECYWHGIEKSRARADYTEGVKIYRDTDSSTHISIGDIHIKQCDNAEQLFTEIARELPRRGYQASMRRS